MDTKRRSIHVALAAAVAPASAPPPGASRSDLAGRRIDGGVNGSSSRHGLRFEARDLLDRSSGAGVIVTPVVSTDALHRAAR